MGLRAWCVGTVALTLACGSVDDGTHEDESLAITSEAITILLGIAEALAVMHANGYVHGRLTANAVVLANDGRIVVRDPMIVGEVVPGETGDASTDMTALGFLAYQLFTGEVWAGGMYVSARTQSGVTKPAAPSAMTATALSTTSIRVGWADNSNNEDNFAIERKTGTSGTYSQIATTAMNVTSYVDTSVNRGVTYCYQIRAVNSAGASGYTNEACKTVP